MSRKRGAVETTDYIAMMRRLIRAAGRRVANADEVDLSDMIKLRDDVNAAIQAAVDGQRERGQSWAYIAAGLGVTRQSAFQKYGKTTTTAREA